MKKWLALLLTAALLTTVMAPVCALAEDTGEEAVAIYGGSSNKVRAKLKTMGQQDWYMMYSTMINAAEEMDLSTFKECAQTETGMWKPAEDAELPNPDPNGTSATVTYHGEWFNIRKDGFMAGDTGFSAALKWVCPEKGVYNIYCNYSGGTSDGGPEEPYYQDTTGYYIPAADGVYMSLYIKGEMMFCEDSWLGVGHRIPQTQLAFEMVELDAGDEIWLVSDPKANGGWDDPWWCVQVVRPAAE